MKIKVKLKNKSIKNLPILLTDTELENFKLIKNGRSIQEVGSKIVDIILDSEIPVKNKFDVGEYNRIQFRVEEWKHEKLIKKSKKLNRSVSELFKIIMQNKCEDL